jgi:hypothetical protein
MLGTIIAATSGDVTSRRRSALRSASAWALGAGAGIGNIFGSMFSRSPASPAARRAAGDPVVRLRAHRGGRVHGLLGSILAYVPFDASANH